MDHFLGAPGPRSCRDQFRSMAVARGYTKWGPQPLCWVWISTIDTGNYRYSPNPSYCIELNQHSYRPGAHIAHHSPISYREMSLTPATWTRPCQKPSVWVSRAVRAVSYWQYTMRSLLHQWLNQWMHLNHIQFCSRSCGSHICFLSDTSIFTYTWTGRC